MEMSNGEMSNGDGFDDDGDGEMSTGDGFDDDSDLWPNGDEFDDDGDGEMSNGSGFDDVQKNQAPVSAVEGDPNGSSDTETFAGLGDIEAREAEAAEVKATTTTEVNAALSSERQRGTVIRAPSKQNSPPSTGWMPFEEARARLRALGLTSTQQWHKWSRQLRPPNMPSTPHRVYRHAGWVSNSDWIGCANMRGGQNHAAPTPTPHKRSNVMFADARPMVGHLVHPAGKPVHYDAVAVGIREGTTIPEPNAFPEVVQVAPVASDAGQQPLTRGKYFFGALDALVAKMENGGFRCGLPVGKLPTRI
jgi:hypothetical protein